MRGAAIGSLIAAGFGLTYVLINSASAPPALGWLLRGLAVAAAVVILVGLYRGRDRRTEPARDEAGVRRPVFGRSYWLIVAAEVVAIIVGVRVLAGPLNAPTAGVAWVSVVVGLHFLPLARVFRSRFFVPLGAVITACGVVGLLFFFGGAGQLAVDLLAGVVPGLLLLSFAGWGAWRRIRLSV